MDVRIDRYYSSEMTKESAKKEDISSIKMYALEMEEPSEDPEVVFQPVMSTLQTMHLVKMYVLWLQQHIVMKDLINDI